MAIHSEGINSTDNRKLIEEAAKAMQALDFATHGINWDEATEFGREYYREAARAALALFEKAHTPTDDEREALTYLITAFRFRERGLRGVAMEPDLAVSRPLAEFLLAEGFRRSEKPQPGARLDLVFREELVAYSKNRIAESWGESINGVDAEMLARQIVGAQEWMWLARGFPVEPTEVPEPSDAEIDAAARAMFAITNQLSMSGARDLARAGLHAAGVCDEHRTRPHAR